MSPQRLKAQNIPPEKSVKGAPPAAPHAQHTRPPPNSRRSTTADVHLSLCAVLQDVVRAMFTPDFIAELFKPQELYSSASARQIFDKLAHSSIMRLSTSSMNKVRAPAPRSATAAPAPPTAPWVRSCTT